MASEDLEYSAQIVWTTLKSFYGELCVYFILSLRSELQIQEQNEYTVKTDCEIQLLTGSKWQYLLYKKHSN